MDLAVDPAPEDLVVVGQEVAGAGEAFAEGVVAVRDGPAERERLEHRAGRIGLGDGPVDQRGVDDVLIEGDRVVAVGLAGVARAGHQREHIAGVHLDNHRGRVERGAHRERAGHGALVGLHLREPEPGVEDALDTGLQVDIEGELHIGAGVGVDGLLRARIELLGPQAAEAAEPDLAGELDAGAGDGVAGAVAAAVDAVLGVGAVEGVDQGPVGECGVGGELGGAALDIGLERAGAHAADHVDRNAVKLERDRLIALERRGE